MTTETTHTQAHDLKDRVALVTGGSRGIGRAICVALANRGATVVINYAKDITSAQQTAAIIEAAGRVCMVMGFSVAEPQQVDKAIAAIIEKWGRLDILVNNAGIALNGLVLRYKRSDWDKTIATNLSGSFYLCQAAARYIMKAKTSGRIINITSVVGEAGNAGQSAYAASKAGIIGLTKSLAQELGKRGVCVNAVSPGFIETDMTKAHLPEDKREALLSSIPLGRIGFPTEVAEIVTFLCSDSGGYVTGQVWRINGGLLM